MSGTAKTKKAHRLGFILTLLFLLLGLSGAAYADEDYPQDIRPAAAEDLTGKVVVLHTNDVHGAIDGYAKVAALRETYEKLGAEVILADAGDFSQGDAYVNLSSGEDAVTLMNAAGYKLATLGNHEFDFGYEKLKENLEKAEFQVICANVYENGAPVFEPRFLYTAGSGCRIGFIGLETEESKTKTNPKLTAGLTFYGGSDMYRIVREQAEELREEGADLVVVLAHLGVNDEAAPGGNRSLDLLHHTEGIDMILDGHSHTVMTAGPENEPIQSAGTKCRYIGVLVIGDGGQLEDHYLVDAEQVPADEASAAGAAAEQIRARVDAAYDVRIAKNGTVFEADREINRSRETNSGNLITEAALWYFRKDLSALKVPGDHLVAVINGASIRAGIPLGDVTKKDIKTVYPFGNTLTLCYVTGEELLEILEASSCSAPDPLGAFPQTAGIRFSIDTTKEYDRGDLYPGSTYYRPDSIRRVTVRSVNGKPFRTEDIYAVAVTNFMAAGGDTYYVLSQKESFDTGIPLDELLVSYIQERLNGFLSPLKYAKIRGDLEVITEKVLSEDSTDAAA